MVYFFVLSFQILVLSKTRYLIIFFLLEICIISYYQIDTHTAPIYFLIMLFHYRSASLSTCRCMHVGSQDYSTWYYDAIAQNILIIETMSWDVSSYYLILKFCMFSLHNFFSLEIVHESNFRNLLYTTSN